MKPYPYWLLAAVVTFVIGLTITAHLKAQGSPSSSPQLDDPVPVIYDIGLKRFCIDADAMIKIVVSEDMPSRFLAMQIAGRCFRPEITVMAMCDAQPIEYVHGARVVTRARLVGSNRLVYSFMVYQDPQQYENYCRRNDG